MIYSITLPSGGSTSIDTSDVKRLLVKNGILTIFMNGQDDIMIGGEEEEVLFSIEKELIEAKNDAEKDEREVKALNNSISEAMAATAAKMFQETFKEDFKSQFESLKKDIKEMKDSLKEVNQTIVQNQFDLKSTTTVVESLTQRTDELNKILYGV